MRFGILAGLIVAMVIASSQMSTSAAIDKKKKPAAPPPTYDDDVKPFLANYCSDCHSGGKAKGGYNMDSYASLMKAGKKGAAVVAGKPEASRIIQAMGGAKGVKPMPPKDKPQPTRDEARKVLAWIQAGAKEEADSSDTDAKKDSDDKSDDKPVKGKSKSKSN